MKRLVQVLILLTVCFSMMFSTLVVNAEPQVIITDDIAAVIEAKTGPTIEEPIIEADTRSEETIDILEETELETIAETAGPQLISLGIFITTAYCTCTKCSGKWGDWTASGIHTVEGRTVAVDPKVIPLGTKIVIDGHTYTAEDTGSGVKGNWIDIFLDSHSRASKYGVQYKEVFVYK